jgi:murein DD-endopeptidase MepM/ murein hydrolase activator NlpD
MKNLYYFSKNKLKFIEIRGFYRKFLFLIFFTSFILSFLFFGTYYVLNEFVNPAKDIQYLKNQNKLLVKKLETYSVKYSKINRTIDSLMLANNDLRISANLPSLNKSDLNFGVGGNLFDNLNVVSSKDIKKSLTTMDRFIDKIDSKLEVEKTNFINIKSGLKNNEMLFQSIPAIKPCSGFLADDFGMRFHPILHVRRMHMGIDIITDIGTPIYSPGGGVVEFTGIKGGYGLTIVINHGFGYKTLYGHLSDITVTQGQKINRGTFIGKTGNSGILTTGPHLHYEVHHNGVPLNPRNFIFDDVNIFEKKSLALTN